MDCSGFVSEFKRLALTFSCAESCTGGMIGQAVTSVPGQSDVFLGSAVTYSNGSKVSVLGVSEETLKEHGAVSCETALEMAEGARRIFGSDVAVAVSGIAGPGGAVPGKPVGYVCIACVYKDRKVSAQHFFGGDREEVRRSTVDAALGAALRIMQ